MRPARGFAQIIIVTVIALILGAVGVLGYQKYVKRTPVSSDQKTETQASPSVAADETANWKTYKSDKLGWQVFYPADWNVVNGGLNCAKPGGSPGDEDTFCFLNLNLSSFTDMQFQVITEDNDEPVDSQETLNDCTGLAKKENCQQIFVGTIEAKKFLYTYINQGVTDKEERIFLLSPSKKKLITIILNYRPCTTNLVTNCMQEKDFKNKSMQILSTFKFTN